MLTQSRKDAETQEAKKLSMDSADFTDCLAMERPCGTKVAEIESLAASKHFHFMTISKPIPKFIALILVSVAVAFVAVSTDTSILTKLDSMSATDYVEYQRKLYHQTFVHHLILWLIVGALYVTSVEFIAYVIGLCVKKPAA